MKTAWIIRLSIACMASMLLLACSGTGGGSGKTVRIAHVYPGSSPVNAAAETFAKEVKDGTNDRIEVKVYPNGQLGGDVELGESLVRGDLDCSFLSQSSAGMDPRLQVGYLPYVVNSYAAADKIFYGDGIIARYMTNVLGELGVHALEYWENDFRGLSNSERPVATPDDLKGLTIRVPELPMYVNLFKLWGAQPVPIPFPELYTALQQGTVDGQDNGVVLSFDSKFAEVQKYYTRTNHAYATGVIACSDAVWDSLSPKDKKVFEHAAQTASQKEVQANRDSLKKKLDEMKKAGVEFTDLSSAQLAEFQEPAAKIWTQNAKVFGSSFLKELRQEADMANAEAE